MGAMSRIFFNFRGGGASEGNWGWLTVNNTNELPSTPSVVRFAFATKTKIFKLLRVTNSSNQSIKNVVIINSNTLPDV